jgi:hypothetical protein
VNIPLGSVTDFLHNWRGSTGAAAAPAAKGKSQTLIDAFKKQAVAMAR